MTSPIPLLDLSPEIEELWDELNAAVRGVLRSGRFILGPNVAEFEREAAAYLGVRHAIGLNSGTDALVIGLEALDVGPGDQVITTPFSFFATPESISRVGATPVFVDIDPETHNLDPRGIEAQITPQTRAILPVHLFGQPVEMGAVRELADRHGIRILEDVAQAFGATYRGTRVGALGDAGAFSFFPAKSLGAFGDAGMLATDDDRLAERARMLRDHGSRRRYVSEVVGHNSRLDELQAAILRVKLPRLDANNERRRQVAARYRELLSGIAGISVPRETADSRHVYNYYTIRIADGRRDAVQKELEAAGISSAIYYPIPLHHLPPYADSGRSLPICEGTAAEVLSLPMGPRLSEGEIGRVADAIRRALA